MNKSVNPFVAARNNRTSAALSELDLVIPRCRIDYFSRSFLLAAGRLWILLSSGGFSGSTFISFRSSMSLYPLRDWLDFFSLFQSVFAAP